MSRIFPAVEALAGRRFGVIADAHVHPSRGMALPPAVLEAFAGVDGLIALGDMGEAFGLDQLAAIAPVLAVRGADDADDDRVAAAVRVFGHGGRLIGAVFDGAGHGLLTSNDPVRSVPDYGDAVRSLFGQAVHVVLCAASHKPFLGWSDGILIVNPGSPTLADRRTVAILELAEDHVGVEHVPV